VTRELLVSGLRLAAVERGVVIAARDLAKLKTWAQAIAAGTGGVAAAGGVGNRAAWWTLAVALALTWISAADYGRSVPALFRSGAASPPPAESPEPDPEMKPPEVKPPALTPR
jgi:phosphatidylglycerophosphate synthase